MDARRKSASKDSMFRVMESIRRLPSLAKSYTLSQVMDLTPNLLSQARDIRDQARNNQTSSLFSSRSHTTNSRDSATN
jgi:hypothetical protein